MSQWLDAALIAVVFLTRSVNGTKIVPLPELEMRRMSDERNIITVAEAAEILGITERGVRKAIAEGRLQARKFGQRSWAISRRSVEAYKEIREAKEIKK
jgi:excisionase family DNA binding protein